MNDIQQYHKEYHKTWYAENKERRQQQIYARKQELKQYIKDYKLAHPCKCGETHPATLDFHHTDPSIKEVSINKAVAQGWSIERLNTEMSKCVILCANCHRKLHYNEQNEM